MFLAAGSGICVFSCGAAVLLQRALLGRQLRDAGGTLGPRDARLPSSCGRGCFGFGGVGTERAGRLRQAVYLSHAERLFNAVHILHEYGAVADELCGAHLVHAVPSIGGVSVQRDGIVSSAGQPVYERGRLDQVAFGAVGRESIAGLGQ